MSGYLSSLLTNTTSRYASLRSLIPTSNSEIDGDTADDTHIARVMRAYYVEKGRPFPAWLPPDPKAAPPPVVAPPFPPVGAGYGGVANGGQSKLGSLWDSQPPPASAAAPVSLRQGGRGAGPRGAVAQSGVAPSARGGLVQGRERDPYARTQQTLEPPVQARPLPSQRAGSYQTPQTASSNTSNPPGSSGGAGTAQDRLKARLWGGAKASGTPSPPPGQTQAPQRADYNRSYSYETPRGGNPDSQRSANTSRNYEDYSKPAGGSAYGSSRSGGGYEESQRPVGNSNYGASRSGDSQGRERRPFMAATAPWASNEDEFSGLGLTGYEGGGGDSQWDTKQSGVGRRGQGQPDGSSRGYR